MKIAKWMAPALALACSLTACGPNPGERPQMPDGNRPGNDGGNTPQSQECSPDFVIRDGGNMFSGIADDR